MVADRIAAHHLDPDGFDSFDGFTSLRPIREPG
jgi:hypothetical protein